jgi:hypothetical protein
MADPKKIIKGATSVGKKLLAEPAPAYTSKVLESTTAKFADKIADANPKLSDAEVQKKALAQATKKLEWERVQKPALEKRYGPLAKASFAESNPNKMQNTAEVVAERKRKANEFLDQPTEPWTPPRPELQAFDRASIKDALEGFPDVQQSSFPRDKPARASTSHVEELYTDPENRALIEKQIKRGLPLGGETFYASLYPVKQAVMEAGMPAEKFDQWIHSLAPASARNSIMNEMAVGQFLRNMNARGIPLTEENVAKEMAEYKKKFGIGLPLMPIHRQGVQNVLEGGVNLREQNLANVPTNYKIPTYGTQKAGDFKDSVVLDVHEAAGQSQGSRYHPYFNEAGGFGNTEYGKGEEGLMGIANELGIPGGMAQAGRWFGGGELTGLKSPRGDALDLLEKQVAFTLQQKGIQPNPANVRKEVLKQIETGEGDLLPWYRKEGMPDVRETGLQRAEGGEVDINASDARLQKAINARMGMAKGGKVDIQASDRRLREAIEKRMAGGGGAFKKLEFMADGGKLVKGVSKIGKKLMAEEQVASDAIGKAAKSAGMNAPVTANKPLTTLQDFHTSLGDSVRKRAMEMQELRDSLPYKYDAGHHVFTEDSARKNWPPMRVLSRDLAGNRIMREDPNDLFSKRIIDPETGKPKRTPYEAGYKVRLEHAPDNWSEFVIPESAIKGNVDMARGGVLHMADAGKVVKGVASIGKKLLDSGEEAPKVDRLSMSYKDVTKRVPEVADAIEKLNRGEITRAQYNDIVRLYKPVTPYSFVPKPATKEEAVGALRGDAAKERYGKQSEYEPGSKVGLRLDIPAYTGKGVWVNSIHNEKAKKVAYGPTASVKNADLSISQAESKRIALGGAKAPYARIKGDWNPMSEEEAIAKAQEYLNHPEWRQIGMDPERHSYFYDRATMQPITNAEEVIQIGPLVLGKNPKYGKMEDFEYADGGKIVKGGLNIARRLFKTSDGYTFKEMPDGRITDGDMTWGSAKEFMQDMPHAYQQGDDLGKRRAMIEGYGRPDPQNIPSDLSKFMSDDAYAQFLRAYNKQNAPKPQLSVVPPEKKAEGGGAFKKLEFNQHFDGGGIAIPEMNNSFEGSRREPLLTEKDWANIKRNAPEVYEWAKQNVKDEASQLKSARGVKDFALRTGAQYLGGIPDLVNLGLMGVDALADTNLSSEKPWFGSEQYIDALKRSGAVGENEFPIAETIAGVLAPAGLIKKGVKKIGGMKPAKEAPKKRRGGLTAMSR